MRNFKRTGGRNEHYALASLVYINLIILDTGRGVSDTKYKKGIYFLNGFKYQ